GFTVLELMTVVVIIVLLITALSPAIGGVTIKAKLASTKMNVRVVQNILTGFSTDHNGEIPTSRAQYVSSATYQTLGNPYNMNQKGIGTWGNSLGASSADNDSQQAPVAIWNVDPSGLTLNEVSGVIFYAPFRTTAEAQSGSNTLPAGGDGGSLGYTVYTLE